MHALVRYNGQWIRIQAKQYEPERQTSEIAWSMILNPSLTPQQAYKQWFSRERENAKVLYPSFRKENARV